MGYKLLLASRSPRRRELIKYVSDLTGFPFETYSVDADESAHSKEPWLAAAEVAERKADAFLGIHGISPGDIIITADTLVAGYTGDRQNQYEILGKPKDDDDARRMLRMLSDGSHYVHTGVTIVYVKNGMPERETFVVTTEVTFAPLSEEDINKYIATGDHRDKAGSYAIQGPFSVHVSRINGEYNNVVGLPVAEIYRRLAGICSSAQ
ncbi:MAG: septum formation protein Maf [Clostridia bacterium]|nr:septum formation protein Maf [Clostridia bacterium]